MLPPPRRLCGPCGSRTIAPLALVLRGMFQQVSLLGQGSAITEAYHQLDVLLDSEEGRRELRQIMGATSSKK